MKALLGGKGANLAEMANLGLPVPPGFTLTTNVCAEYYANERKLPDGLMDEIRDGVATVQNDLGRTFGGDSPLLFSVRSGAASSMPGMMDTVLNLGLTLKTVKSLGNEADNPRFAWDSYRRFITMFADVVMGVSRKPFETELEKTRAALGVERDSDIAASDMKALVEKLLAVFKDQTGEDFPQDPWEQLERCIVAVFDSWNNERAIEYRRIHHIADLNGTAVNVQAMVFGNLNEQSGTGVGFTRDPSTGENKFFCDVLFNAQGEDVVAGTRTPEDISALESRLPDVHRQLLNIRTKLETHYRDMQDIEFTIQDGRLYLLQTRNGKRTAAAALQIAMDLVNEGVLTRQEALSKIEATSLNQLLHPSFDPDAERRVIGSGIPASPGAATGVAVFDPKRAEDFAKNGRNVILVREETSPEDIKGMAASVGILTARGGRTSHAAVVARQMGKVCVAGCSDIHIDETDRHFRAGDVTVREGSVLSLDGATGEVMLGDVATVPANLGGNFATIMEWADEFRTLNIRTNADTPEDAIRAREFGAEGIGLCRTEHMFFEGERINKMREMILATDVEGRRRALAKLAPMQRDDFLGIFRAMDGLPVTIRLLDPPLHEFLPRDEATQALIAEEMGVDIDAIRQASEKLHEVNPMLGLRGCRLAIHHPEIYDMQIISVAEAVKLARDEGIDVHPEIMIPLVGTSEELRILRDRVQERLDHAGVEGVLIGTMIEVPRAALTADQVAEHADFFSFGTNDLTQMTLGVSRDDAEQSFLANYVVKGIYPADPFAKLDQAGVGKLVQMGIDLGRTTKPNLKIGICGEHGGEPSSVAFCHSAGMDYVSCSPFRVPIARLAAAQAAIAAGS